ncbi:MAG TPA: hypothetical protein VKZ18_22275 [Polyangia bacterium]|nr:hypothetical protein [Polyangia bacterium]
MARTSLSLSDLVKVAVDDFKKARGGEVAAAVSADLAGIIEVALLTAVRDERRGCVAECARRAELWEKTGDKPDTSAPLRAEARARAAEARYLGDLLAERR